MKNGSYDFSHVIAPVLHFLSLEILISPLTIEISRTYYFERYLS